MESWTTTILTWDSVVDSPVEDVTQEEEGSVEVVTLVGDSAVGAAVMEAEAEEDSIERL